MSTLWFDACRDYQPPNSTINAAYVQNQLDRLREIILQKRRIMRAKPFILWDNDRAHAAAAAAVKKAQELGFRLLKHPPTRALLPTSTC